MRAALARLKQSRMISSSIRFWLTGGQVGWTTKTSPPRTSSSILARTSPSGKSLMVSRPRVSPRWATIFSARAGLARPLKTRSLLGRIMRHAGVRGARLLRQRQRLAGPAGRDAVGAADVLARGVAAAVDAAAGPDAHHVALADAALDLQRDLRPALLADGGLQQVLRDVVCQDAALDVGRR